jgi:hypothetical protein
MAEPTPAKEPAAAPRRFTEYDIWGDDDSASSHLTASRNPLRQVEHTEELASPREMTPQQALRNSHWNTFGPQPGYEGAYPQTHEEPWYGGLFANGIFVHSNPNDPHRSIGLGEPLVGTSWLNRPWYVGPFIGGIFNDDLISGRVRQNNSALGGIRLGRDFDHYWGIEGRFGYSNPHITLDDGTPIGVSRNYLADASLLYYPWGDSRWRPYISLGMGQATFRFTDDLGHVVHESLFSMPLSVGVKYFDCPWMTFRFDFTENIAFGSHNLESQANFSLGAAVEFRFGGRRPSYFPWHGNTVGW